MAEFDIQLQALMRKWQLPGAQLAIAKNGRLLLSRGYGYADLSQNQPVQTNSLFRVGSVSKTFTTVAILKLIEAGHLRLDDKAFRILSDLKAAPGTSVDPRFWDITIQHLLQHEAGWQHQDALELPQSRRAAAFFSGTDPPNCATIIRFRLGLPLDYDPGSQVSYSNFGYCVLGRVIEAVATKVHGRPVAYEEYVKREVLAPSGISRARLGGTRLSERAPGEVRYYGPPDQVKSPSVYPGESEVPFAYGGFYLTAGDASGGWIASAEDLVRFADSLDGQRGGSSLLRPATFRLMLDTPIASTRSANGVFSRGLCWTVVERPNGEDFWHTGALKDSNASWLVRTSEGITLALNFNSVGPDPVKFLGDVVPALLDLVKQRKSW